MSNVAELYEHLKGLMKREQFLSCAMAHGETPFYICPYAAADESAVQKMLTQLISQLTTLNIPVLKINLFNLCVELLKADESLQWLIDNEKETTREDFGGQLCDLLEIDRVVEAVRERVDAEPHKIVAITGIGNCYPFLRAHIVLTNLASVVKNTPLVMFFPGEYCQTEGSGATLTLHGRKHGDGYYRAFDIRNCIF